MNDNNTETQIEITVGEILRNARTTGRRKREIQTISKLLCIREEFLQALEDGDYGALPEPVYVLGFARNYAMELGLNPDEIVTKLKREMGQETRRQRAMCLCRGRHLKRCCVMSRNLFVRIGYGSPARWWRLFCWLRQSQLSVALNPMTRLYQTKHQSLQRLLNRPIRLRFVNALAWTTVTMPMLFYRPLMNPGSK